MQRAILNHSWKCPAGHLVGEDFDECSVCMTDREALDEFMKAQKFRDESAREKQKLEALNWQNHHDYFREKSNTKESPPQPASQGVAQAETQAYRPPPAAQEREVALLLKREAAAAKYRREEEEWAHAHRFISESDRLH